MLDMTDGSPTLSPQLHPLADPLSSPDKDDLDAVASPRDMLALNTPTPTAEDFPQHLTYNDP
eukprot:10459853-Alexandrium_andersonii.AAC.1